MRAKQHALRAGLGTWVLLAALAAGTAWAGGQGSTAAKGKTGPTQSGVTKKDKAGAKEATGLAPKRTTGGAAEPFQLKTFPVRNADPDELRTLLPRVLNALAAAGKKGPVSTPGVGGNQVPRVVVDGPSRTVFVRGTEAQVGAVADALAVLDAAPGEGVPEGKNVNLCRLHNARAQDAMKVLTELGLSDQVVLLSKSNSVLVLPGAQAADVQEVVAHLDTHSKAPPRKAGGPAKNKTGKGPTGGGAAGGR